MRYWLIKKSEVLAKKNSSLRITLGQWHHQATAHEDPAMKLPGRSCIGTPDRVTSTNCIENTAGYIVKFHL